MNPQCRRDSHLKTLLAVAAFTLITIAVYLPVVKDIKGTVNGSLDDAYAIIWQLWWLKHALVDLWSNPFFSSFVESPAGVQVTYMTVANHVLALPLTWALGPVASYNIMILFSFVLSAVALYLLVLLVTGSHAASFISGLAYSFSPYHTAFSATGGMDAAQIQYMPLTLLFIMRYERSGRWADLLGAFAFFVFALFSFGYYAILTTIVVLIYLAMTRGVPRLAAMPSVRSIREALPGGRIPALAAASVIVYAVIVLADNTLGQLDPFVGGIVALGLPGAALMYAGRARDVGPEGPRGRGPGGMPFGLTPGKLGLLLVSALLVAGMTLAFLYPVFGAASRPISDSYMAPLFSYFVPAPDHPVLGGLVPAWLTPDHDPFVGKIVYAGAAVLALAIFALVRAAPGDALTKGFFAAVLAAGALLTLPPALNIGDFSFHGPVYYLHKLVPPFVDVRRVVLLIILAISVLAGLGVHAILGRLKGGPARTLAFLAIAAVVGLDLYPGTSVNAMRVVPGAYGWLEKNGSGSAVVEYPLTSIYDSKRYEPFYGQTIFELPLLNPFGAVGHDPRPADPALARLMDRGGPLAEVYANTRNAAGVLSGLGVGYVVVRTDKLGSVGGLDDGTSGLRLMASFPDSEVYAVTAEGSGGYLSFHDFYRTGYFLNYLEGPELRYARKNPYVRVKEAWPEDTAWLWMGPRASLSVTAGGAGGAGGAGDGPYDLSFMARSAGPEATLVVSFGGVELQRAALTDTPVRIVVSGIEETREDRKVQLEARGNEAVRQFKGLEVPDGSVEASAFVSAGIRDARLVKRAVQAPARKPLLKLLDGLVAGKVGAGAI